MEAVPVTRAYAAVDLGASSGRVVLGACLDGVWSFSEMHRFENSVVTVAAQNSLTGTHVAWDLPALFESTLVGLEHAAAHCAAHGWILAGIGIDSWGVDWVTIDPNGEARLPGMSYRGAPDPAPVIATRSLSAAEVFEITGVPDQAINTGLRLAAQRTERSLAGETLEDETLLFLPDLWIYWLTGEVGTDPTIASTSQLFDARTGAFSEEVIDALQLSDIRFPPIHEVGTEAGTLSPEIGERIGTTSPVPVIRVAGHDTAAAFAWADPNDPGGPEALISSGTWSLVGGAFDAPITSRTAAELGFSNERGAHGALVLQNLTGLWTLQECLREWGAGSDERDELLAAVNDLPYDARVFDTADPELLRADDMEARVRALCVAAGRPLDESRTSVVHAILDSLAAAYAAGVSGLERMSGRAATRVRIVGGGSRNARLCSLTAQLTGLPVLAGPTEASSIGNIALQAQTNGEVAHAKEVFTALDADELRHYSPSPAADDAATDDTKERHT